MFVAKKKEADLKAKTDKERQYQSMFRPHINQTSAARSNKDLNDSRSVSSRHIERSENLYLAGKDKLQKIKAMTDDDLNKLERSYDENLTF